MFKKNGNIVPPWGKLRVCSGGEPLFHASSGGENRVCGSMGPQDVMHHRAENLSTYLHRKDCHRFSVVFPSKALEVNQEHEDA